MQTAGIATDARTDVYSLGIVIHEMVTGARPGVLESPAGLADEHLAAVVRRCVASSPEERWSHAGSVLEALDARSVAMKRRRVTRRLGAGLAAIVLVGVAVTLGTMARGSPRASVAAGSSAVAISGAGDGGRSGAQVFFGAVDPVTANPDALAEYRRGMTDLRDAVRNPQAALLRATKLDPDFSAALLRRSFNSWQPSSAHFFNEAVRTRTRLDPRDLELLSAEEPLELTTPPDLAEGERRFRALLAKRPGDAEVALRLGWIAYWRQDRAGMMESHDLVRSIDSTMAAAEASLGYFARELRDLQLAETHYQACTDTWPGAVVCLTGLGRTKGEQGACGDYFALMRRAVILTPDDWSVRLRFLESLLAAGGTEVEAQAEVQIQTELFDSLSKHLAVHAEIERALWFGSFVDAARALDRSQTIMRETTGWSGITFVGARLAVAEETGDDAAAVALARRYVGHRSARPPAFADALILSTLARRGVMPLPEIEKLRDAWRREAESSAGWAPWQTALYFEGALATTPRDADAALAHVDVARLPTVLGPGDGLLLGRLFLLAGRPVEARDTLRNAAGVCAFMDSGGSETYSTELVQASYELGRAGEESGDIASACAGYQRVLDRWGHARPRSLTADSARAARARLGCYRAGSGG